VVAGAVGVDAELVANDPARPGLPLETGHVDRQHLGTDEALVEQGQPVVLGAEGTVSSTTVPPTHREEGLASLLKS